LTINELIKNSDFTDADFIEKIEIGSKTVFDKTEEIKKTKYDTLAEGIRQECKIFKEFLDYVFGEGTSQEVFEGKDSLHLCLKAFEDIINQKEEQVKSINNLVSKYSPERVQR